MTTGIRTLPETHNAPRIGVVLPHWTGGMDGKTPRPADTLQLARLAEDGGLDSVWLTDHLYSEDYVDMAHHGFDIPEEMRGVRSGTWECWTLLSALATETSTVEIGTLVTNTGFRNPALLAKMAHTVDDLSDGRLVLGLGAGDFPLEHEAYGFPFEGRVGRFEEALQVILPLLRGDTVTFSGDHYTTREAMLLPDSVRPSGPPILIGVIYGRPRMARLAVQYADQWNSWLAFWDSHPDAYGEQYEGILRACERHGRDVATLDLNVSIALEQLDSGGTERLGGGPLCAEPERLADCLRQYHDQYGVRHITVWLEQMTEDGIEWLARIAELARQN